MFLAVRYDRADPGLGIEARNASAPRAATLSQRALRIEFKLEFTGKILAFELLVLADIGRDHFFDLLGVQKNA